MLRRKARLFFKTAMTYVRDSRPDELRWARKIKPFQSMTPRDFLWMYCWVIYTSGFRVSVIEDKFGGIQKGFKDFDIGKISKIKSLKTILRVFNNERKARSFVRGTKLIHKEGFSKFKERVTRKGPEALEEMPGIGKITWKHLSRNIGLADLAKDDVHVRRLVKLFNARNEKELVGYISGTSRERKGVVDAVLWRFCADKGWKKQGYDSLEGFCKGL
jgi:hypothetical protein